MSTKRIIQKRQQITFVISGFFILLYIIILDRSIHKINMKRKKKILTIIVLATITLIFILPAIGFSILNWGVLPPEKLTPLVIEQANKFIDAHLDCERVELTYFETYPYLGVKLTNGHLISHAAEDSTAHEEELAIPSDSLLAFNRATLSLQPLDYLLVVRSPSKTFPSRTRVSMDSSIKTDVRTGIFTKVRRIRQRPMQAKSPCRLSTCKRYASTEDISRMTTAKLTFLPKCRASSYALTVHWLEEPIHSIWKWAVHPFYSVTQLIH